MKRLVLCVEGQGECASVPILVGKLMTLLPPELQSSLFVDDDAIRVGGVEKVTGKRQPDFERYLRVAAGRKNTGAVLVVMDADADTIEGDPFCHVRVARLMAERAKQAGAGKMFSLAVALLRQEYESFLIASAGSFPSLRSDAEPIPPDVEKGPRGAKGWLDRNLVGGYRSVPDQMELTRSLSDWTAARTLKSFCRLERAILELASAVATGQHVSTPGPFSRRATPVAE